MKKATLLTLAFFVSLAASASADQIAKGQTASCNNANAITVEVAKVEPAADAKNFGHTANDRGTANLVVWKSSNFTTVPLTLGPNDSNATFVGADHGLTGIESRGENGRAKIVLTHQPEFSRGDSIGDISGLVKITNTGVIPVTVSCN